MTIQWKPLATALVQTLFSGPTAVAIETLVIPGVEGAITAILRKPDATATDVAAAFAGALGVYDQIATTARQELDALKRQG